MDGIAHNAKSVIDYANGDMAVLEDFARRGKALGTDLDGFSLEIKRGDFSGKSMEELLSLFREFLDKFAHLAVYLSVTISLEKYLQDNIREGLDGIVPEEEMNSALVELTAPYEHDAIYKERVDLLNIALAYHSGKNVDMEIERHIYDFGNVRIRWCMGAPWTNGELLEKVRDIKDARRQLDELAEHDRIVEEHFRKFEAEHADRKKLIAFIRVAKWFVWLRTYRTEILSGSIVNIYPLLAAMAQRMGLGLEDIKQFTIDEVLAGKPIGMAEIERRRAAYAYVVLDGKWHFFSGDDARFFIDWWARKHPVAKEIKGTVASRPVQKIGGFAKIVLEVKDLVKVEPGDILVAAMTEPNFVPAMEKAAAFVTDEGGILCHAAIVGREMRKPCIIGTGNATKALKDGDYVELDLVKGTVMKVED
ncbi:MAG: hypothetical protein KGH98_04220 [Candidatus Micrarchaeota archaeon]|nr:hypothetical protein [Candidatus Micrarchaeota archaeon]